MKLRNTESRGKKNDHLGSRQQVNYAVHQPQSKSTRLSRVTKPSSRSSKPTSSWDAGDAASRAPPIGPANYELYPASETVWSYEVTTESEIYRVSTVPNDFIGNSYQNWPRTLSAGHDDYKAVQSALAIAKMNLTSSRHSCPDTATYVDLQKKVYRATYNEAKAREGFLKIWPSAFGWVESLKGHVDWNRHLERDARTAQREALDRCREHNNQRLEKRNGWLRESVDEWSIRPIYAMSPDQYEELHETVTNKKKYLRKKAEEGNWETNTQPPKTITLPQLPPPKTGLCVPQYSSFERNILHLPDIYRLPDSLFKYLKGDKHDGN